MGHLAGSDLWSQAGAVGGGGGGGASSLTLTGFYFVDYTAALYHVDLSGTKTTLNATVVSGAKLMKVNYDQSYGKVFMLDDTLDVLYQCDPDGTNVALLLNSTALGPIATSNSFMLDLVRQKIVHTSTAYVISHNYDGTSKVVLTDGGVANSFGLTHNTKDDFYVLSCFANTTYSVDPDGVGAAATNLGGNLFSKTKIILDETNLKYFGIYDADIVRIADYPTPENRVTFHSTGVNDLVDLFRDPYTGYIYCLVQATSGGVESGIYEYTLDDLVEGPPNTSHAAAADYNFLTGAGSTMGFCPIYA